MQQKHCHKYQKVILIQSLLIHPTEKGWGKRLCKTLGVQMLRTDTLIILEEGCEINAVEGFSIKDCRRYGSSYAHFLKLNIS